MTQNTDNAPITGCKLSHMRGVAEYMRNRASEYGLDKEKMYLLGLLHDVGYLNGWKDHAKYGAELLKSVGMDECMIFAVQNHGNNPYTLGFNEGKQSAQTDVKQAMLVLLLEADLSVSADGKYIGFETRLSEIESRHSTETSQIAKEAVRYVREYCERHEIIETEG